MTCLCWENSVLCDEICCWEPFSAARVSCWEILLGEEKMFCCWFILNTEGHRVFLNCEMLLDFEKMHCCGWNNFVRKFIWGSKYCVSYCEMLLDFEKMHCCVWNNFVRKFIWGSKYCVARWYVCWVHHWSIVENQYYRRPVRPAFHRANQSEQFNWFANLSCLLSRSVSKMIFVDEKNISCIVIDHHINRVSLKFNVLLQFVCLLATISCAAVSLALSLDSLVHIIQAP